MASAPDVSLALSMDLLNKFQLCLDYLVPDQPPCVSFQPPPPVNDSPDAYPSLSPACPATASSPLSIKVEAFSVNDRPRLRIYAIRSGNGTSNESPVAAPNMPTPPSSMSSLPVYPTVQNGWSMFQQTDSGLATPSGSSSTSESEPYSPPLSSGVTTPSDFPVSLPGDTNPFPVILSQSLNTLSSPQIPGSSVVDTLPSTWHWDDASMITPDCSDFVRAMGVTRQWNQWDQPSDPSMFSAATSGQFIMPPPLSGPGIDGDFDKLGLPPLDMTPSDQDEEISMDLRPSLSSTSEPRKSGNDAEQVPPAISLVNASQPDHQINALSGCPSPPPSPRSTSTMLPTSTQASGEHVFSINPISSAPQASPSTFPLPSSSPASPEASSSNGQPIRTARRRGASTASLDGNTCSCHAQKSDGVKSRSKKQHMHCSDCEETFTRRHDLLRHEVRLHGKVCDWVCERCEKFFSSAARLKRHECSIVPRLANRPPVTAIATPAS